MKRQRQGTLVPLASLTAFALLSSVATAAPLQEPATGSEMDQLNQSAKEGWAGLREWLGSGEAYLNLRPRFENVDVDGFNKEASAFTLRTVLGYKLGKYGKFTGALEFEDVQPIGDSSYNSTINGNSSRPVIADPAGGEVNQAYLIYSFDDKTLAKVGRQEVVLDNARFIGNVGWRQNHQSFDAVAVVSDAIEGVNLLYAYVQNANRINGDFHAAGDIGAQAHLLHLAHKIDGVGDLAVYDYLLDLDIDSISTTTMGARLAGDHALNDDQKILYAVEYAMQKDAGDNPNNVDANYMLGEIGMGIKTYKFKLGYELLEGDGTDGQFNTPLATLHAFNGWADMFLATPTNGLEDTYFLASGKFDKVTLTGVYHSFSADSSSADYGTELDFSAGYAWADGLTFGLKYADFSAENGSGFADTTKYWLWADMSF
ncbi:MAG: alginate export family protein [Planctomycetota bacterium]